MNPYLSILVALTPLLFQAQVHRLDTIEQLQPVNVKLDATTYRGRKAIHVTPGDQEGHMLVVLPQSFKNGSLEIEVAGQPAGGAFEGARGFIGLAFHVRLDAKPNDARYECFYLRPTNGRSDDQLRRNHSTQYMSEPDYPWQRLRKENPGGYESYVDLEPGVWTKMKIVVQGTKAQLYVHDAPQPVLIVNDLKLGETQGGLALWIGDGTDGYFSNLTVRAGSQ